MGMLRDRTCSAAVDAWVIPGCAAAMNTTTKNTKRTDDSGEQIVVEHSQGRWGAVPDALLEDTRLSLSTRAVAAWICGRAPGWKFYKWHILKTLGLGLDTWWNVRRQLMATGYLVAFQPRAEAGRFNKMVLRFDPVSRPFASICAMKE